MSFKVSTVAILGAGSLGRSILSGILDSGFPLGRAIVTTRSAVSAQLLPQHSRVEALSLETHPEANVQAVAVADCVVLAVKPWQMIDLVAEVAPALKSGAVLVSLAAGVPLAKLEAAAGAGVAVIRAMPNTPASVAEAVTGLARGSSVSDDQLAAVAELFATVGKVPVIAESMMNQLTAVSGSGPAYVFYLLEQFTAQAEQLGFDRETAAELVEQTFYGALQLQRESGESPAELRRRVTSPGGTTESALRVLQGAGLDRVIAETFAAAIRRGQELADEAN